MQEVNSGKETDKGHLVVFLFSKKLKHEYDSDLRSNEHYLSLSLVKMRPEKTFRPVQDLNS